MRLHFYKYQGAGNDFIVFDVRKSNFSFTEEAIKKICNRNFGIGADGLLLLSKTDMADFQMKFFNPDGSTGMFCGNGGRCIAMFAKQIKVVKNDVMSFMASDGIHFARVVDDKNVVLKMSNVNLTEVFDDGIWINSGTSHFVTFVDDLKKTDVVKRGRKLRNDKRFDKYNGANIDFVSVIGEKDLVIRTYERGVEDETLACGTGITAAALAYGVKENFQNGKYHIVLHTLHDDLTVDFNKEGNTFNSVMLSGPAIKVFEGEIEL